MRILTSDSSRRDGQKQNWYTWAIFSSPATSHMSTVVKIVFCQVLGSVSGLVVQELLFTLY